ncbi:unnamed protein product [Prorocentrum cordatum]|uniref:Pseudouridine synthase RsuA/RluA-like domain-containing protein n=1 Tax=Prorocentrum cordatum TaxID=2364126 RepID=A0ABN9TTB5_9DINO|nr:unnamed protein product [Polarella glacialis]
MRVAAEACLALLQPVSRADGGAAEGPGGPAQGRPVLLTSGGGRRGNASSASIARDWKGGDADVFAFFKPKPMVTDLVHGGMGKVARAMSEEALHVLKPVGQLDKNTTGLMLFTNSGRLAEHLNSHVSKRYRVWYYGWQLPGTGRSMQLDSEQISALFSGVFLEREQVHVRCEGFEHGKSEELDAVPHASGQVLRKFLFSADIAVSCGLFHVVKRLFQLATGRPVRGLRRVQAADPPGALGVDWREASSDCLADRASEGADGARSADVAHQRSVAAFASMVAEGDVLPGPKFPVGGCGACGESGNRASRLKCRGCGATAPARIQQDARAAAAKVRPGGRRPDASGEQSRSEKELKDLKAQLASLTKGGGGCAGSSGGSGGGYSRPTSSTTGGDLSYAQVLVFLRGHGIDTSTIAKVEEAKVRKLDSKPPAALAARRRVDATRKVGKLEERLQQFEAPQRELRRIVEETTAQPRRRPSVLLGLPASPLAVPPVARLAALREGPGHLGPAPPARAGLEPENFRAEAARRAASCGAARRQQAVGGSAGRAEGAACPATGAASSAASTSGQAVGLADFLRANAVDLEWPSFGFDVAAEGQTVSRRVSSAVTACGSGTVCIGFLGWTSWPIYRRGDVIGRVAEWPAKLSLESPSCAACGAGHEVATPPRQRCGPLPAGCGDGKPPAGAEGARAAAAAARPEGGSAAGGDGEPAAGDEGAAAATARPEDGCAAGGYGEPAAGGASEGGAEHRSARLRIELRELKVKGGASSPLGALSAALNELPEHSVVTRKLESKAASLEITFQLLQLEAMAGRRTVYFVRHAESEWNVAKSSRNLYDMVRTTDHPLSDRGLRQAEELSARAAAAADQGDPHGTALHQADVVYVSPLTRTVQTAVILLGSLVKADQGPRELVLMANARERQGLGGMDTRSRKIGLKIVESSFDSTKLLYANHKCANVDDDVKEVFKPLRFDVLEVLDRWWCETTKESDAQMQERLREFMAQLMYSPCRTVVVVGHSLFFREVFRVFLSKEFADGSPELARALRGSKLANCGVACLHLEPARGLADGPITHVELVLGSQVESARAEGEASPSKTRQKVPARLPSPTPSDETEDSGKAADHRLGAGAEDETEARGRPSSTALT